MNILPSKRNATLGSGAPVPQEWGQQPHGGRILLAGVTAQVLPQLTISDPHGTARGTGAPEPSVVFLLEGSVYHLQIQDPIYIL